MINYSLFKGLDIFFFSLFDKSVGIPRHNSIEFTTPSVFSIIFV